MSFSELHTGNMAPTSESTLSSRGQHLAHQPSYRSFATPVLRDLYHPTTNPNGNINLGQAENYLMLPEVASFANQTLQAKPEFFSYNEGAWGPDRLRRGLARHMNKCFKPVREIEPDQLLVANGCMSLCELLGFSLCSEGDGVLFPSPVYAAFQSDFSTKAGVKCVYTAFGGVDQFSPAAAGCYERALLAAEREGTKVRALMLCNPHNPLGRCYPKETLVALLKLCQKYSIHFISDEIYALSTYSAPEAKDAVAFESILSFYTAEYIAPELLHVLYGMSKDFACGGLRIGCLYTRNESLWHAISAMTQFHWIGGLDGEMACRMLEDEPWLDAFFLRSQQALGNASALARKLLNDKSVAFDASANAGFFLWLDVRRFLQGTGKTGWDAERELNDRFLKKKVYLTSGELQHAEEPGFFRVVFSYDEQTMREGFRRIFEALNI